MNDQELLPDECPFCGEETCLEIFEHGKGTEDYDSYVQCQRCNTCGPTGEHRADAVVCWNRRHPPAVPVKAGTDAAKVVSVPVPWQERAGTFPDLTVSDIGAACGEFIDAEIAEWRALAADRERT